MCIHVCVSERFTQHYGYGYGLTKQSDFFFQFLGGFTSPFLTVLNAPSPFVNTSLSSSKHVCFAMRGFFFCTSIITWNIAECAKSINTESIRGRGRRKRKDTERVSELGKRKQVYVATSLISALVFFPLFPPCVLKCVYTVLGSTVTQITCSYRYKLKPDGIASALNNGCCLDPFSRAWLCCYLQNKLIHWFILDFDC